MFITLINVSYLHYNVFLLIQNKSLKSYLLIFKFFQQVLMKILKTK